MYPEALTGQEASEASSLVQKFYNLPLLAPFDEDLPYA